MAQSRTAPGGIGLVMVEEPREPGPIWTPKTHEIEWTAVPDTVRRLISERPGIVEDLADWMESRGSHLVLEWPRFHQIGALSSPLIGPVATARYIPRIQTGTDMRLGHRVVARNCPNEAILLVDAHAVSGAVIGDMAAGILKDAGVQALIIEGKVRDIAAISQMQWPLFSKEVGVLASRFSAELQSVNADLVINDVVVKAGYTAVMNAAGLVMIPPWMSWDEVLGSIRG